MYKRQILLSAIWPTLTDTDADWHCGGWNGFSGWSWFSDGSWNESRNPRWAALTHSHTDTHTHTTGADSIIIANRMYRHTVTLTSSKLYAPCTVPDQMKWIGRARTAEETIFFLLNNEFVCTVGHFVHLYMDHVTSKFSNQRHVVVDPSGMSSLSWLAARTVVVWKYSSPATWGKCSHL